MSLSPRLAHARPLALGLALPLWIAVPSALAQPFPIFTNPTNITNPFYPVSNMKQAITLGIDSGDDFRSEVTLLPFTKNITWDGGTTKARVSQYTAYRNGDLVEVAYDFFAQADDGTVYYFGEDVFNYEDGVIVDTEGTWIASPGGAPIGELMPAKPEVGYVFYPENFPPLVWEEATVVSLDEPTTTPKGPINNGLLIHELLLDGAEEFKVYAAGWGQVEVREDEAQLNLAMLNRVKAPFGTLPGALDFIESHAEKIMDATPKSWNSPWKWWKVSAEFALVTEAWKKYKPKAKSDGAPQAFIDEGDAVLAELKAAIVSKDAPETRQAANDVRAAVIDLMNYYNPEVPADIARLEILEAELRLDVQEGDWVAATIDHAKAADAVWARLRPFVKKLNGGKALANELNELFAQQAQALEDEDKKEVNKLAGEIIQVADELSELY
jgi:hypothetical protein